MKVEVIKGVEHSIELNFGESSVCITPDEAQNLIAQLRAVVPVPADVDEAADHYAREWHDNKREMLPEPAKRGFIAGAEWQRNKPIPEDFLEAANQYIGYPPEVDEGVSTSLRRRAFADGMLAERERLVKDAVECNVIWYDGRLLDFTQEQLDAALDKIGAGVDAKVSVIIIKKEK